MFYKAEDSETGESANSLGMEVKVGFLRFSLTTLWTSSVSIVITSVPMMIFVLIFRNYRPLPGPRTKKHLKGKPPELTNVDEKPELKENTGKSEESQKDSVGTNLQSNLLPHYWCYIGWLLLVATAATCAFFLVLYSMQWGITTSEEWLTSFVISFFESIFVMDPIKSLRSYLHMPRSISLSVFAKFHYVHVTPLYFADLVLPTDSTALPPDPVPRKVLAQSRKRRLHEEKSQRVFFDLLFHIFFVFCVYSLSYGKRDVNAFFQNDHLDSLLFQSSGDAPFPFQSITKREEVMRWMKETMLPVLFPRRDSLGNSLQLRERVFTSDPTSFRVGPVRVRQLRMPFSENLERTRTVGGYSSLLGKRRYCPPYSMGQEETGMYCVGWKPLASCSYEERNTKLSRASWMYQSFEGISSLPVWGTYSVYSSGGYVMDFSVNW
ncbi:hypothetical protein C0Q70_11552 [Pomacea canaliculata]|uniref:Polycystin domain-containing protein n=1 Tax=Pomacea canaliculata TaxID=400727 RepID=A0A2T7P6E2_POMCA|nr:hypothetical protein C0Q70_11552 [Pomacea canaliculata]